jgi:methyl-accepting chemotaxis protein
MILPMRTWGEAMKRTRLTAKVVVAILGTLLVTSAVSFWITQNRVNQQAEEAFRDKVRQITGMASATRVWFSNNIQVMVPDKNFRHLEQVPVVVAWKVAQDYASAEKMTFHTPSLAPRDSKNVPDAFERRALENFQKDPSLAEYSERGIENGEEVMRYAQPVRLTSDCLLCHGNPAGEKDPFGYTKEGMHEGDLRGAFAVRASTQTLVATSRANSLAIFLITLFTLLATGAVMFVLIRRLVVRPLSASVRVADAIADGNLAVDDLKVESGDEIAQAMTALNAMKNRLRGTVRDISEKAEQVAAASSHVQETSGQIAANSEETSAQVSVVSQATQKVSENLQSVSAGASEMTTTIHSIAGNAQDAAAVAAQAVETARAAHGTIAKLGDSSAEIGEVVKVITSIARQTNLLALNATIEATRAGEAGKGFAVVANEVKDLAKQTAQATDDIGKKIRTIQENSKEAVSALTSISDVIHKVSDIAGTIATAVEEQSATTSEMTRNVASAAHGSTEIASNIEGVEQAARGTSSSAHESQKSADELATVAQQLRELMAQFNLDESKSKARGAAAGN